MELNELCKLVRKKRHKGSVNEGEWFWIELECGTWVPGVVVARPVATSPWGVAFEDATLIYLYRPSDSRVHRSHYHIREFIIPPIIVGDDIVTGGICQFDIEATSPTYERLKKHCFWSIAFDSYYNENGKKTKRQSICGEFQITLIRGLESRLCEELNR